MWHQTGTKLGAAGWRMARPGRPWYRTARKMWYATLDGTKHPLGVTDPTDESGATAARDRLIAALASELLSRVPGLALVPAVAPPARANPEPVAVVRESVAGYLHSCELRGLAPKTVSVYRLALTHFCETFGARAVHTLEADEVEAWARRENWSASTRNDFLGTIRSWLKWAKNPLPVRRPAKESRGADVALDDEQFARVLAVVERRARGGNGDLGALLRALRETGARTQEVAPLTVDAVDWAHGCIRLRKHKTAHRGKLRTIHLSAAALAVFDAQRERYGTGLLFRTRYGRAYSNNQIVRALGTVSKAVGFRVIATGLGRHSYATRALEAGVPDATVAELLGHTGTAMLTRHYGHLGARAAALKAAAELVSAARAGEITPALRLS